MLPETAAILAVRQAVRAWLNGETAVAVALSGGADSLALTAGAVAECGAVHALIVDHGLQPGSADVARVAAEQASSLGCVSVRVVTVEVGGSGGLEAAARTARYAALDEARDGRSVLIGHTLDDQAETVLLGLARGSGPRSIAGMVAVDPPWGRPLLGVRRAVTRQACVDLGLSVFEDPHNSSDRFTRVRVRHEALPLLEEILGGGVAEALARTADQLRDDGTVLDALADELLTDARIGDDLDVAVLEPAAPALRRRALRAWLLEQGAKSLTDNQLRTVDRLVSDWCGQGGVAVGGGLPDARLVVARRHGKLSLGLQHQ